MKSISLSQNLLRLLERNRWLQRIHVGYSNDAQHRMSYNIIRLKSLISSCAYGMLGLFVYLLTSSYVLLISLPTFFMGYVELVMRYMV